jgi:hypothetical protein
VLIVCPLCEELLPVPIYTVPDGDADGLTVRVRPDLVVAEQHMLAHTN